MKKTIILSIVLLTTLSLTVISNLPAETQKQEVSNTDTETEFERDLKFTKKLKLFNAKDYLQGYEHKKQAKKILNEATGRFESASGKHFRSNF